VSAIADRARDFWARISPRERGLVMIGAIAAPIVIAIWLGMAIGDGLSNMEARNDKLRKALTTVEYLKVRGPQQPTTICSPACRSSRSASRPTWPTRPARPASCFKATTPRSPIARNGFTTSSVSFSASDLTIDQLKKFLQEIETKSRYVVVTHLEVNRPSFKTKEKLDANFEVFDLRPRQAGRSYRRRVRLGASAGSAQKGS